MLGAKKVQLNLYVAVLIISFLAGCAAINPVPELRNIEMSRSVTLEPLVYEQIAGTEERIAVPAGFVTDYASIPQILQSIFPDKGRHGLPSVVHDYLYWTQACERSQADRIFLIAMEEHSVGWLRRSLMYWAVESFGGSAWERNRADKESGGTRILAEQHRIAFSRVDWEEAQKLARDRGDTDPQFDENPTYCSLGEPDEQPT